MLLKNLEIDRTIWFHRFGSICSGVVKHRFQPASAWRKPAVCIEIGDGLHVLSGDDRVFASYAEAALHLANDKQQSAARLMTESAALFKDAGIAMQKEQAPAPEA